MLFGVVLSLAILYIMYLNMTNAKIYLFQIPWQMIFGAVVIMYILTILVMLYARADIKNNNIISDIRDENI